MRGGEMRWVRATGVVKELGGKRVLDEVDLVLEPSEAVAIVGPNGAGKTTLLKVLCGLLDSDQGEVQLKGRPIAEWSRREIAGHMAVVPQAAPQSFSFSVLEFVLMGRYAASRRVVPSTKDVERARGALLQMEMEELEARSIAALSGGEMQRALMARAMVTEGDIWMLDEPTASLDMRHQKSTLGAVRAHVDGGSAALAVLHDLGLVHRYFDRVVVLKEGQVRAEGKPEEVLDEALVSEVYETSMRRGQVGGHTVWVVD